MTKAQIELIRGELINTPKDLANYLEKILINHVLTEKSEFRNKSDYLSDKDLQKQQVEYILYKNYETEENGKYKYFIFNYYQNLAKHFNTIAIERSISRNSLWHLLKENKLFRTYNKTKLRIYKHIYRGELIPSISNIRNSILNSELISFTGIRNLSKEIDIELNNSHEIIIKKFKKDIGIE